MQDNNITVKTIHWNSEKLVLLKIIVILVEFVIS